MTYRHIDLLPGMRDVESEQFERLQDAMDELRIRRYWKRPSYSYASPAES